MVLRAIIDNYIETAEPVGSRTIARKHDLGVSSATIRNEMADLEETGYLHQPPTYQPVAYPPIKVTVFMWMPLYNHIRFL